MSNRQTTSPEPIILSYGRAPRWWETRWARRVAITGILLAFLAPAVYFAPRCCEYMSFWYCQRQCAKFNPPPTTVVYERLPFGSVAPAIVPPYMSADDPEVRILWHGGSQAEPFFEKIPPVEVNRVPICWLQFMQQTGYGAGPADGGVVFCHELVNPLGATRLVTVRLSRGGLGGGVLPKQFDAAVYAPATWTNPRPQGLGSGQLAPVAGAIFLEWGRLPMPPGSRLLRPRRVFPGQTDPGNASHFTIEYEWPDSVHGFIDGWLLSNDAVNLVVRPGPGDIPSAERSRQKNPSPWDAIE